MGPGVAQVGVGLWKRQFLLDPAFPDRVMAKGFRHVQKQCRALDLNEELWWDTLPNLVDFSTVEEDKASSQSCSPPSASDDDTEYTHRTHSAPSSSYHGPCHTLPGYKGFLYFPQALGERACVDLAHSCLTSYCEPPHDTNIDNVPPKPGEEIVSGVEGRIFRMWMNKSSTKAYRSLAKLR